MTQNTYYTFANLITIHFFVQLFNFYEELVI